MLQGIRKLTGWDNFRLQTGLKEFLHPHIDNLAHVIQFATNVGVDDLKSQMDSSDVH